MWNCNGSASPAVLRERRVLLIVTLLAAAGASSFGLEGVWDSRLAAGRAAGLATCGDSASAVLPGGSRGRGNAAPEFWAALVGRLQPHGITSITSTGSNPRPAIQANKARTSRERFTQP